VLSRECSVREWLLSRNGWTFYFYACSYDKGINVLVAANKVELFYDGSGDKLYIRLRDVDEMFIINRDVFGLNTFFDSLERVVRSSEVIYVYDER